MFSFRFQFVSDKRATRAVKSSAKASEDTKCRVGIIQDRELNEMSDEGMCLSMHQPWASLLIAGIKM